MLEKDATIKKLELSARVHRAESRALKEALSDCLKYRRFLDRCTPTQHFDEQVAIKRARGQAARRAAIAARREAPEAEQQRAVEEQASELMPVTAGFASGELEGESCESSGEELPMHFQDPELLMDRSSLLEKTNRLSGGLLQGDAAGPGCCDRIPPVTEATDRGEYGGPRREQPGAQ